MRVRFTIDIERKQPPEQYEPNMSTTASQVELDGHVDAGELKAPRMTEPVRMGFEQLRKDLSA